MRFEKVSENEFLKVCRKNVNQNKVCITSEQDFEKDYEDIKLPKQGTEFSAGMDFHAPFSFRIRPNEAATIPTGIRWNSEGHKDKVLLMVPRSGLGFKTGMRLVNTVGVIDADYCFSDNEGHIMAKIFNPSGKVIDIEKGTAFMQGIIVQYFICKGSESDDTRNGGFGSTGK